MALRGAPKHDSYDVVIIGGAMIGSSVAWWTSRNPDFTGRILVVERDPTYEFASTSHTNSCIRQQFGTELNIRISQFGAEFIKGFRGFMDDPEAPEIPLHAFGYLYLADTPEFVEVLRENQRVQAALGAGTRILTPNQIAEAWPFYDLEGILLGSHNPVDEGYFDGGTIFDWFRRKARALGAEYLQGEVAAITRNGNRVTGITLASGEKIGAGIVVNASGPRANVTAQMAGLHLPVEPRRRYTFIFDAAEPLPKDLPLTIDPAGVHMRTDGRYYMAGCPPDDDPAVAFDDFSMDHTIWEDKVWPAIASPRARIRAREGDQFVGRALCLQYARSERDCRAASGGREFHFCKRLFRPRASAIPRDGSGRVGTDHLWGVSQPRSGAAWI